jgi:hypothetical protein
MRFEKILWGNADVFEKEGLGEKAIRNCMKTKGEKYRDGGHEEGATRVEERMPG